MAEPRTEDQAEPKWKYFGKDKFKEHVSTLTESAHTPELEAKWANFFPEEQYPLLNSPPAAPQPGAEIPGVVPPAPEQTTVESQAPPSTPPVLLSGTQQRVRGLVARAKKDAPLLEEVKELSVKTEMAIPPEIKKAYPERIYRWGALDDLEKSLSQYDGAWEIVAAVNHEKILPLKLFDIDGAITYKGQNILIFTRRSIGQAQLDRTIKEFDFKYETAVDGLEKSYSAGGREVASVRRIDDPGDGGHGDMGLVSDEEYDYADTGADPGVL